MAQNNSQKLIDMKKTIDEGKLEAARLEGQQSNLLKQLETDFSVKTLQAAERKLPAMDKEIEAKESQLQKGVENLENSYEW